MAQNFLSEVRKNRSFRIEIYGGFSAGFGLCGITENLIGALRRNGVSDLVIGHGRFVATVLLTRFSPLSSTVWMGLGWVCYWRDDR